MPPDEHAVRDSIKIQALLAKIGEKMGFKVWIPRQDRASVLREWKPEKQTLLDDLPLNYDLTTFRIVFLKSTRSWQSHFRRSYSPHDHHLYH